MRARIFQIVLLLLILSVSSCQKTDTSSETSGIKTLVIVSDNDPGSDLIVGILGAVRSARPDMQVQFFQTKPFDVFQASYLMWVVMTDYPKGTCIAGIVEPGASSRRMVYHAGDQFVLAPDNMLSTRILDAYPMTQCYFVENSSVLDGGIAGQLSIEEFYKRAILSLIAGTTPSAFGPACLSPLKFRVQEPLLSGDTIKGEILFTDNFGNCITNIPASLMANVQDGKLLNMLADTTHLSITMGVNYSSVSSGENVCFINNSNRLQLSVNYGDFSAKYKVAASSKIALINAK
ncbi:MAG: SAM-dependent chlorinase/fluorinase [Bacteroidota bacterium]